MLRLALVAVSGCGFAPSIAASDAADTPATSDATDAAIPLGPWGTPTPISLSVTGVDDPTLTSDLLELYFNANADIYVTTRLQATDPWGPAKVIAALSTASETTPEVSYDGLRLMFASTRSGAGVTGDYDLWISTRPNRTAPWEAPMVLTELDSVTQEAGPVATPDQLAIVFSSYRKASLSPDLYYATRAHPMDPWSNVTELATLNTNNHEGSAFLTADKLTIYFDSDRDNPGGPLDIYMSHRDAVNQDFPTPQKIDLDTAYDEEDPWVSPDGRHIVYYSDRDGIPGLWEAYR